MASFTSFSFFFFIFFLVLTFQTSITKATYSSYHDSTKCSHGGPSIHYPFHIKGHTPLHESLPGFELLCKENFTTIHFPSYSDLVVKSICYDTKKIQLLDPKNCVHGVFLNLNLSSTPFQYYHVLKNYTYLNCSTKLSTPSFTEVPCLSGSGSHVYTLDPELHVPGSCNGFKTVAIPFEYSPYISDNSLGLALTWNLPHSEERKDKAISKTTDSHTTRYTVLGLSICSLAVAIALVISIIKVTGSTWNCSEKEDPLLQSLPNV